MIVIVTVAMILLYRLQDSRLGRAWKAIREDELAAASNGINTVTTKLLAFALGASTAGFAGVFSASQAHLRLPGPVPVHVSFTVLAMVVLGGMGNIWGVAAGAFIVFMIQKVFLKPAHQLLRTRSTSRSCQRHRLPAVPVPALRPALVLMMLLRPRASSRAGGGGASCTPRSGDEELASPREAAPGRRLGES